MGLEADTRCFSLRRVNPFLGVVAVVKTTAGRALSVNGRDWQIQVLAHPPRGLWSRGGDQEALRYFRFGVWSAEDGLSRVPLNPVLDAGLMLAESERLVDQARAAAVNLPFPLAPELEHWLLDREGAPLALLGTALADGDLDEAAGCDWSAGARGEDRPFVSATLASRGIAERDASGRRHHVESVERLIAGAAAPRRQSQWFRTEGDAALGLAHGAPCELEGRRLPLDDLPPLTLRTEWPEESARRLVAEYVAWMAPYLLTLPGLPDDLRRTLEPQAARYALAVDALWRLYPRVLDADLIKRARVEARLRYAGA